MKMSPLRQGLSVALFSVTISLSVPAFGQDTPDLLSKALNLVRQVEKPPGNPPSDSQRMDLLSQAIMMAQQAPNHHLQGHRVLAIQAIRTAIATIKNGDPNHQAATYLETADTELSKSVLLAGGTTPAAGPAAAATASPAAQTAQDFFNQGWSRMQQSDWRGAVAAFDQAIKIDPQNVNAYLERGASKLMLGDRTGGMADYNQAIKIDPKNTDAYLKRAEALGMSDPKSAIADYQQVITLDPKNRQAYEALASLHWMHQQYDATIAAYDQLIALDPKDSYYYGCRALAKAAKGDVDGAIADNNQDIALDPTDFNAFHNRGQLKKKKGDLPGALADLNQAIALGMRDDYVYRERADIKKALGDLDGALTDYDLLIGLDRKNHGGLVNLADVYLTRGDLKLAQGHLDGAMSGYQEAIDAHAADTQRAYFGIWMAQQLQGKKADADSQLSSEIAKMPDCYSYWPPKVSAFLLGKMNESDFIKAAASTDARTDGLQHCQAWYYAGFKHLIAGDKSTAADDFRKSLATNQKDESTYLFAQAFENSISRLP